MRLRAVFICGRVDIDPRRGPIGLGEFFDGIVASVLPVRLPDPCFVVARIADVRQEADIALKMVYLDQYHEVEQWHTVKRLPAARDVRNPVWCVIPVSGLELLQYGEYRFTLIHGSTSMGETSLFVARTPH